MPPSLYTLPPLTQTDLDKFRDDLIREIREIVANQSRPSTSLLRLEEVQRRTGYKRSSLYAKVASGEFPAPVDLGGGRGIAWREDLVSTWIDNRPPVPASRRGPRKAGKPDSAAHVVADDLVRDDAETALSP